MAKQQNSKPQPKTGNRQKPTTNIQEQKGQSIPRPSAQLSNNPKKK